VLTGPGHTQLTDTHRTDESSPRHRLRESKTTACRALDRIHRGTYEPSPASLATFTFGPRGDEMGIERMGSTHTAHKVTYNPRDRMSVSSCEGDHLSPIMRSATTTGGGPIDVTISSVNPENRVLTQSRQWVRPLRRRTADWLALRSLCTRCRGRGGLRVIAVRSESAAVLLIA